MDGGTLTKYNRKKEKHRRQGGGGEESEVSVFQVKCEVLVESLLEVSIKWEEVGLDREHSWGLELQIQEPATPKLHLKT